VRRLVENSRQLFREAPLVIGEAGIPFNLQGGRAYRTGDFTQQVQALDDVMQALEASGANFTLWNYTADNTNAGGDSWNGEDFSLFSRDQQAGTGDLYDGGRALEAAIRPHAVRTPGIPRQTRFSLETKTFVYTFEFDPAIQAPLELFVPRIHYPGGVRVTAPGGRWELDMEVQRLLYYPAGERGIHTVRLAPACGPAPV
jgi:hypothetical protein